MDQHRSADAIKALDPFRVAEDVHSLAASDKPIAPLVNEALQVINEALDTHGCVQFIHFIIGVLKSLTCRSQDHVSLSFNGGKDCGLSFFS